MKKARGSGHYFGIFLLGVVAFAVFLVSITLSLTFFQGITPPDKPWFPYFGLSLTEGGFLCWLGAFLWVRHHAFHTFVEFTMTCASLAGIVATAGVELFSLMPGTTIDVHSSFFANVVGMVLEAIFLANIISVFIAAIVFYSEANPGWFRGVRLGQVVETHDWPEVHRGDFHAVPRQRSDAELLEGMKNNPMYAAWFNWMETQRGGEPARPLASPRNQPKEEYANLEQSAEVEEPKQIEHPKARELKPLPRMKTPRPVSQNPQNPERGILSEGVSLLTQKLKSSITSGRTAVRVRGNGKMNTSENMSTNDK